MIAQLTGIVVEANFTSVILDVNGVGYDLSIPLSTFDKLPPQGQKVTLKTVMAVRHAGTARKLGQRQMPPLGRDDARP